MNRRRFLSLSTASAAYYAFPLGAQPPQSPSTTPGGLRFILAEAVSQTARAAQTFQTRDASVQIDDRGFITSLNSRESGKEYSPAGHPSPLLSLHESGQPNDQLVLPTSAVFHAEQGEIELKYPNGAIAVVKMAEKEDYFRFQLVSLNPRGSVDNIVWGPLHTTVSKLIGDIIGVVRDDDWAIGMLGLDDNTITGPVTDGDCAGMGYYVHSPDPMKYPLPPQYKEGQWFNIGGNGTSDTAFYSHPEEYFQQVFGNGAKLEPDFGSTLAYHARDRRKSYPYLFSLLPGFQRSRPRHQVSDPVDVDFIGSGIALYACPDNVGLATIEKIILAEGLPHIVINGKWVRDPASFMPTIFWNGPRDKCIEYTQALGWKDISQETKEFYASLGNNWVEEDVKFSNGQTMTVKEFSAEAHKHGLTNGGLHTLCLFLQAGVSNDVTPIPSMHLQTVLRTKLAKDISPTDTDIVVTDPSFLAEMGTWPMGNNSNFLRIGGELLEYEGISETAPWTLRGVKRGYATQAQDIPAWDSPQRGIYATQAQAHKAGDELVKLQQNCYHGFAPDMVRLPEYAEYYADLMYRNGMDTINFDGFESTLYQNHGYYAVRIFCRRLFETYAKLTGGRFPRVTGSCVFAGAWEYMNVCDLGGGNNMFNPISGHRGIEGKDVGSGFGSSYFPATFGIQDWLSDWSVYDAQNLQAKAIGLNATYGLNISQEVVERSGEKDAIFKSFRAWENARAANVFTKEQKQQLKDPDYKFNLVQTGEESFLLSSVKEIGITGMADNQTHSLAIKNPYDDQPLQFALRFEGPDDAALDGLTITLPGGQHLMSVGRIKSGEFIICKGNTAYVADKFRKKTADLELDHAASLPSGDTTISVKSLGASAPGKSHLQLTVWAFGKAEPVRK
jgi:hypothetical protein